MAHKELTEAEVKSAFEQVLAAVGAVEVTDRYNNVAARAGFNLILSFLEGDQTEVRERFWKLFDFYCSVIPLQRMVWWWRGAPKPFGGKLAQAQLHELKDKARSPDYAIDLKMGSDIPAGDPSGSRQWEMQAKEHFFNAWVNNSEGIWDHDQFIEPGSGPCPSFVRICLPVSWILGGGDTAGFVKHAVELMQPRWATAGWAIVPHPAEEIGGQSQAQQRIFPWLERFPGLDAIDYGSLMEQAFNAAMPSINWLNFVSDPLLDKLGGREQVRAKVEASEFLSCKDVGNCLMIQAGPFPSLSDTHHGLPGAPGFGEAARLLKPIRVKGVLNSFVSSTGSHGPDDLNWQRECEQWFSRFDRFGL